MALEHYKTQILLLHSEEGTLRNLSSGFNDRYSVHLATSGTEALNIFTETPVDVIVSAQDLPGMSGLDAVREAKKRSPDTIGILLAGTNQDDGLEALVDDQVIFQVVRGPIQPNALRTLVDSATKQARLLALSNSANDTSANLDLPVSETIVMETAENGSAIISDGTGQIQALRPDKISAAADAGSRQIDLLVMTKDDDFLATIKDSARGLHNVHHAVIPAQAMEAVENHKIGVLVTDAAMVGAKIEIVMQRLRQFEPRLVAIVAGRRDDGELLMDLINRGHVYRFLLKPVSPGRARLAIEASVNHHLAAPEKTFKVTASATAKQTSKAAATTAPAVQAKIDSKSPPPLKVSRADSLTSHSLDEAFTDDSGFAETVTGIVASVKNRLSSNSEAVSPVAQPLPIAVKQNPKFLAVAVGMLVAVAGIAWFALSPDSESPVEATTDGAPQAAVTDAASALPSIVDADILQEQTEIPTVIEPAIQDNLISSARNASDTGQLITPPGDNAIELYLSVLQESPNDPVAIGELAAVVDRVFSLAESAILGQRDEEAETAVQMLQLASPGNPRLPFLNAQLVQLQLRNTLENARIAIREVRLDDAGGWLGRARDLAGADSAEVNVVSYELSAARNEQQEIEASALATADAEAERIAAQKRLEEQQKLADEARAREQQAAQAAADAEAERIATQQRLEEQQKLADEARAREQQAAQAAADAEAERIATQQRLEEQQRLADEARLREQQAALKATEAAAAAIATSETAAQTIGATLAPEENQVAVASPVQGDPVVAAVAKDTPLTDTGNTEPEATIGAGSDMAVSNEPVQAVADVTVEPETATATATATVAISTLTRTKYVAPKYPRSAHRRNVTGSVDVSFTVQKNGEVTNIAVLASRPGKIFNDAATEAIAQWRFEPVIENGQAVPKYTAVRMSFNLE